VTLASKSLLALAALIAIAGAAIVVWLPPAAAMSPDPDWKYGWPVVKGAFHVHSSRSDGTGTIDEIAAAAARAGLQFIILTDHGDGTRAPDPPSYRSGVLVVDAVEVSTNGGHYVALDLPQMPFRLGGQSRDVIEDVARAGGFGIAAHPTSHKADLRWQEWDAPFDGIEWLSADSEWRDEPWPALTRALLTYPVRPTEALATLLDRPDEAIARWDHVARARHVVGMAAADAHARLSLAHGKEEYAGATIAPLPSYESSFRVFTNHVVLDSAFTGDANGDAMQLLSSIRAGRVFSSVEGLARLGGFEMKALSAGMFARPGEYIDSDYPVELEAVVAAPPGTTMIVVRDGAPIYDTRESRLRIDVGTAPGVYRVEAHLPGSGQPQAMPWLASNPIYVNLRAAQRAAGVKPAQPVTDRSPVATQSWHAEASPGSESALSAGSLRDGTPALHWRVRLAEGRPSGQFAAIWFPADRTLAAHDRVQLRALADRPMRVWAQLRAPGQAGRWAKSFYLGTDAATIDLQLTDFRALDPPSEDPPPLDTIDSLLLVVDTVNTVPGTAATISIADLWLVK
jgi:hypothetical protein